MNARIRNKRGISIISGLVVGAVIGLYLVTAAVPSVSTAYAEETPEVSPVKARE